MGMLIQAAPAADALFPSVLQQTLALLFCRAEKPLQTSEVIRRIGAGTGAVHRVLKRLEAAALVTVDQVGHQKFYRANEGHPVFAELSGLVRKTVGLAQPLREMLAPLEDQIETAFVFGSMAHGAATAKSDIDLMVISATLLYPDLYELLPRTEQALGRPINPHLETPSRWRDKVQSGHHFARAVAEGPRIVIIGAADGVG